MRRPSNIMEIHTKKIGGIFRYREPQVYYHQHILIEKRFMKCRGKVHSLVMPDAWTREIYNFSTRNVVFRKA